MKRFAWILLIVPGCTCSAPASVAAVASADAPSGPPATARVSDAGPEPPSGCGFRWGYHGAVAGQEVFLRIERAHEALAGRYFYAKVGSDLALSGTIDASGTIDLVEGDPRKPTGRFAGTCRVDRGDPAKDAEPPDPRREILEGTWSNAGRTHPFRLESVGPRASPLVAVKRLAIKRDTGKPGPLGSTTCAYGQETVELFGAGSPEAERAINRRGARDLEPWLVVEDAYKAAKTCETPIDASAGEHVSGVFRGLVTLERGGTFMAEGAAHPANAVEFARVTYDLATGAEVKESDLFTQFPEALMRRCVAAYGAHAAYPELLQIDGHELALRAEGVHVFGEGYPHFASALTGQGPIVTWAALLRAGALRADSPVKRAWEGLAPAKQGAAECLDDEGHALAPSDAAPDAH